MFVYCGLPSLAVIMCTHVVSLLLVVLSVAGWKEGKGQVGEVSEVPHHLFSVCRVSGCVRWRCHKALAWINYRFECIEGAVESNDNFGISRGRQAHTRQNLPGRQGASLITTQMTI
jgi:hypothetical protein